MKVGTDTIISTATLKAGATISQKKGKDSWPADGYGKSGSHVFWDEPKDLPPAAIATRIKQNGFCGRVLTLYTMPEEPIVIPAGYHIA